MSGSQHNPNGRQSQLGSGWSPLQLQMANLLARAPQAHMANDRGVTWHTPTPPPHLYHVPAPSPPDPLQAMKNVGSNSVFRHTATPPELYRHTPTPPDKHNMMRHTPSPGDVKSGPQMPPVDLFPHLGPARDKLVRAEELLAYARVGVDLSLGSRANGAAPPAAHPAHPSHPAHPALSAHSPALSVRDAPTINSLIGRGGARRVDSLLERLAPAPASPHSVIVHPRAQPTPSPPSSNEDSADSCGAAPGSKRKRKPERTVRLPHPPPAHPAAPSPALAPAPACAPAPAPAAACAPAPPPAPAHSPAAAPSPATDSCGRLSPPAENGVPSPSEAAGAPPAPAPAPAADLHSVRRKTRSGSAETIADIAAMIADGGGNVAPPSPVAPPPLSVDKLKSVLASPEPAPPPIEPCAPHDTGAAPDDTPAEGGPAAAAAPEPAAASFVEVENQLEKMFAALDDQPRTMHNVKETVPARKRRKSAPGRNRSAAARRAGARGKPEPKARRKEPAREGYDSGSNASSGRSRAPYIQIVGPCASPASVVVMNAGAGEEEEASARRGAGAAVRRRGLHASTLGLRYDAATRDASWLCAFCSRGPHAAGLGDLFGPYPLDTDLPDYRALDASARRRIPSEVWVHAACAVWAPGVVAAGARVWGLARATCAAAAERCRHCTRPAAPLACALPRCPARAHLPCAQAHRWLLDDTDCRAHCPAHKD